MSPGLYVLLVEDGAADAELIRLALRTVDASARTQWVRTLAEAIRCAHDDGPFDVVLLDLSLPDSHGLTTVERLCGAAPHTPVVVLTGQEGDELGSRAIERGAQDYLFKEDLDGRVLDRSLRYALERVRGFRRLKSEHELLQSVIDSLDEGVVVVDEHENLRAHNPAARSLLGPLLDSAETSADITLPDMRTPPPIELLPISRAARGEHSDGAELYLKRGPDDGRWITVSTRALTDQPGGVVVVRDVTEQKLRADRREKLLATLDAASRLKQNFIDGISHELRTPLTPLLGYARLLLRPREELTERHRGYVEQILEAAGRLQQVVESMLSFREASQLATGRSTPVDLRALVEEAAAQACAEGEEGVELRVHIARAVPGSVRVDGEGLRSVVDELLANAFEFTQEGWVDLDADWQEGQLRVSVSDTGAGIRSEHQPFVFDAFYKEAPGLSRRRAGPGLGLSRAAARAQAMGGRLTFESEYGRGSTFTLDVPAPSTSGD